MEFILPVVAIEAVGDWSFTKFVEGYRKKPFYKVLGYASYIAVLELFQKTIEVKGLSWANAAWDGWSNIVTGLVALLIFKEKPTLKQFIGMILISFGIFFLGTEAVTTYNNAGKSGK
jgi:multidrug transporter EmrE-like cation transporter